MAARLAAMPRMAERYEGLTRGGVKDAQWTGMVRLMPLEVLMQPFKWRRPRLVFVNSMSDLFHEGFTLEQIDQVVAVMALNERHTFQVLTKRPGRTRMYFELLRDYSWRRWQLLREGKRLGISIHDSVRRLVDGKPLRQVWLGTSVEDQRAHDERVPELVATPGLGVRFLSCEPLLGPLELELDGVDWVIVGGESGPGARPMHPEWVRSIRDQCVDAGVAFFFKQWGAWLPWEYFPAMGIEDPPEYTRFETMEWRDGRWRDVGRPSWDSDVDGEQCVGRVGKKRAGRLLDGRTWDEMPGVRADGGGG
jgi:protein gp37